MTAIALLFLVAATGLWQSSRIWRGTSTVLSSPARRSRLSSSSLWVRSAVSALPASLCVGLMGLTALFLAVRGGEHDGPRSAVWLVLSLVSAAGVFVVFCLAATTFFLYRPMFVIPPPLRQLVGATTESTGTDTHG